MTLDTTDPDAKNTKLYHRLRQWTMSKKEEPVIEATEEDKAAIRQIRKEDLWYKIVPAGLFTLAGYGLLVRKRGFSFSPFTGFVIVPTIGVFLGLVAGTFTVDSRVLEYSPNGSIAKVIRENRGLPPLEQG